MEIRNSLKISVIVPVYNAEKHLRELVDSILCQTFKDFELLLIDDGSTDGSPQIVDEYAGKDSRVRVFHKINGGVSSARNMGLDNACGEYVAFADNDDYMFPDCLDTMYAEVTSGDGEGYDLLICGFINCKRDEIESAGVNRHKTKEVAAETKNDMCVIMPQTKFMHILVWNQLFKKSIINDNNIRFIKDGSEDEMFSTEFFSHIHSLKCIDYKGYVFIKNENSLSSSHKYIASYQWISRIEGLYDRILDDNKLQEKDHYTYLWRVANRLVFLCVKGYYSDSHMPFRERMGNWSTVSNDPWLRERIDLNKLDGQRKWILRLAKSRLYCLADPFLLMYFRFVRK